MILTTNIKYFPKKINRLVFVMETQILIVRDVLNFYRLYILITFIKT